jgi:hypothetical protein
MADMADPMLFTIPLSIWSHFIPRRMATMAATEAERISTIWFEPDNESSPKMKTLMEISAVRKITGIRASISFGLRFALRMRLELF